VSHRVKRARRRRLEAATSLVERALRRRTVEVMQGTQAFGDVLILL
jgi:hypothetical protein